MGQLTGRYANNYLRCIEAFGPFQEGTFFFCFNETQDYLNISSEREILGIKEFKVSIVHKDKFIIC